MFQTAESDQSQLFASPTNLVLSQVNQVLVLGDETAFPEELVVGLGRQGFHLTRTASARQLVQLVFDQTFDLVLLSLVATEYDGFQVLAQLRARCDQSTLPILVITSQEQSDQIVKAFQWGANDYLIQPVDFDVLLTKVRTQISLKRAQAALRDAEERYAIAARGANDGLWDWNLQNGDVYYSPRWLEMLGLTSASVTNRPEQWFSRVHAEDRHRVRGELDAHCRGETDHFEVELRMLHEDGGFRWMLCRGLAVRDGEGRAIRIAGSLTDITEGKVADALTGLPNRLLFMDRLRRAINRYATDKKQIFAVLYLDIDNFKVVNDSLGHGSGDELLIAVAQRIENCVRSSEALVARLGGDEFAVLLEGIRDVDEAITTAERAIEMSAKPFSFNGRDIFASISVGIAIGRDESVNADDLLREADTAMYQAKSSGRNRYQTFDPNMLEQVTKRLEVESDLRRALDRGELQLYYQPIVSLETGRISAFEALVRWMHPTYGLVSPDQFIGIAEETGLIVQLGTWVLREACRQLAEWQKRGDPDLTVSVNVSSRQLSSQEFVKIVENAISKYGIRAQTLKLEITESTIMENPEAGTQILRELRALGVRVGIDDFGTGYSSLSSLHHLPLDVLKVDRSFVMKMDESPEHLAIVRTIMALAESLNLSVIAEGIETDGQRDQLGEMGCQYGQGYFFSHPVGGEQVDDLLGQTWPGRNAADPTNDTTSES